MNYPLLQKTSIALTAREQEIILKWFPCQYHPIVGYPSDSGKPQWVTWKKITDETKLEIFADLQKLVGVGFNKMTRYTVLDIDRGSPYHPANDKAAFDRLLEALESFGITGYQILRSSNSGGIHIYCPFSQELRSFGLAASLKSHFQANGFEVKDGSLEIFPNKKTREAQYKKHRLPLQPESGSMLLDSHLEPLDDQSLEEFDRRMEWAAANTELATVKASMSYYYKVAKGLIKPTMSPAAIAYMEGLKKDLDEGWTDDAQTNEILGRIVQYHYVFEGLVDLDELAEAAYETAVNAKGYEEYCDHRPKGHEPKKILDRCREWSKSIINSDRYYVYGSRRNQPKEKPLVTPETVSEPPKGLTPAEKAKDALDRQIRALEEAIAEGASFDYPTHLKNWLVQKAGSSLQTITKNWDKLSTLVDKLLKPTQKPSKGSGDKDFSLHPKVVLEIIKMMCNPAPSQASSCFENLDKPNSMMCNPAASQASGYFEKDCIKLSFVSSYEPCLVESSNLVGELDSSDEKQSESIQGVVKVPSGFKAMLAKLQMLVARVGKIVDVFGDEKPLPLPPKFFVEFNKFLSEAQRDYSESLPDIHYSEISRLLTEIELEHYRINYPHPWGEVESELNRLDPQRLWLWLKLVTGLSTVDKSVKRSSLEQSESTAEDIRESKRLRKRRGWQKYQQMIGAG